jgi:hypothetical protein
VRVCVLVLDDDVRKAGTTAVNCIDCLPWWMDDGKAALGS